MLVCSKAGYLTEIEIKRSYSDFLADFKKRHHHEDKGMIKRFYYCVPESIYGKVRDYLAENEIYCTNVLTYDEELWIRYKGFRHTSTQQRDKVKPLTLEQQFELARLGCMRVITLKKRLIKLDKHGE